MRSALEQRGRLALDVEHGPAVAPHALLGEHHEARAGVEQGERELRGVEPVEHARLLLGDPRPRPRARGHGGLRRQVARADVLGQRAADERLELGELDPHRPDGRRRRWPQANGRGVPPEAGPPPSPFERPVAPEAGPVAWSRRETPSPDTTRHRRARHACQSTISQLRIRSRLSFSTRSRPGPQSMTSVPPPTARMVSLPGPASIVSRPSPPLISSEPSPPMIVSSPRPPSISSPPRPPSRWSSPVRPKSESRPRPPSRSSLPPAPSRKSSPPRPLHVVVAVGADDALGVVGARAVGVLALAGAPSARRPGRLATTSSSHGTPSAL